MALKCLLRPVHLAARHYSTPAQPIFVMETYELVPRRARKFRDLTTAAAISSKALFTNMLFSGVPTTGGQVDLAFQIHHFPNHAALAPMEPEQQAGVEYDDYIKKASSILEDVSQATEQTDWHVDVLKCIQRKYSTVFVEAKDTLDLGFQEPNPTSKAAVYEFRQYQLKLGYDTVPNFLKFYSGGLPSKLKADPRAKLVTLLYSDIGTLNTVIEIWRHDSIGTMMDSRIASREATEWRGCIASIAGLAQTFTNTIVHPQPESRWQ